MSADRWCSLYGDEPTDARAEAAALWEVPNPANVRLALRLQGPFQMPEVDDLIRRELGGIGYCAEKAVAAGEVLKGVMSLQLAVSKDGSVYDTLVMEDSKIQSPTILRCAAKRFRRMEFTLPEPGSEPPPPPPAPEPKRGRRGGPPPAPAAPLPPRVFVNFEFP